MANFQPFHQKSQNIQVELRGTVIQSQSIEKSVDLFWVCLDQEIFHPNFNTWKWTMRITYPDGVQYGQITKQQVISPGDLWLALKFLDLVVSLAQIHFDMLDGLGCQLLSGLILDYFVQT